VGGSSGTIDNSYATGLVNGSLIIGGLVGGNSGSISNSYAMGGVSGVSQVGGLVGYNLSGGKISNSNAAGSVNGSSYVGGLVGYNGSTGTISYSFATGSVSGAAGADYLGGLVGDNAGTISNSYAAGTIQAGGADYLVDVGGAEYVGGLVGYNTGSITNSSATGSMTAATGSVDLGGLVGANAGTISGSYATGWVQAGGADDVGGLVGYNLSSGTINNSYATGLIQAGGEVYQIYGCVYLSGMCYELPPTYSPPVFIGGLVGYNAGAITNSYALSYVTGFGGANYVGGLVGGNYGSVTSSYAKGLVTTYGIGSVMGDIYGQTYFLTYPPYYTGGLVGYNAGSITNSYAAGGVVGNGWIGSTQAYPYAGSYGSYGVGGLVGRNSGSITNSYATGAVSGSYGVGGLVGYNLSGGKISNSYAVGSVIGARSNGYYSNAVGGLAGYNYGTISNSYSTGSVSGAGVYGNYYVGGLTGYNSGTVSSSFWDITTSGQATSPGGAGLTDAQMQSAASFTGWSIAATGGSGDVWRIYPGQTYPLLLSFMTPLTLANTTVTYNGSVQSGAATTASGVLGSPTSGTNAGGYDTGYYSAQQGYDISGGTLTIEQLASVAWVGGATGNWSTASNWAGGAIPDLSNVAAVTIPKGKTVTYDSGVEGPTMLTTLTDSGNLVMAAGDLSITGNLSTAGYQQTGGTLDVAGALTIKSTSGGVTLGDITAGTLSISSKAGAITQLAATMLDVTGTTTLTADNGLTGAGAVDYAITLANGGNQFVGAVTSTGSNIDLAQGAGGVVLGATLATGTLTVDSLGGAITQSAGKTLAVTGTTSLTSDNGTGGFDAITLGQAGNNFGGAVTADGSAVTLKDAAALTAVLDSSGAATLTSVGAMDVSGTVGTTLKTTTTGTNAATTFGATTVDTSLAVTSTGTVTETSSNILKVDGKGTTTVSNPKVTVNGVKGAKIPGS
jgi:hypothetical protein